MQIHPQVKTRKILLVGHSQGTFYTNEMYKYLVTHGVPPESIAVYNLATPASFVAGGGQYLTSSNDKMINKIRDTEVHGNARIYADSYYTVGGLVSSALRANIALPKESGWETSEYGGHGFSKAYLSGAGARIVHDIETALSKLRATETPDIEDGCFEPPAPTIAYAAEKTLLGVGDSIVAVSSQLGSSIAGTASSLASVLPNIIGVISTAFGSLGPDRGQVAAVGQAVTTNESDSEEVSPPTKIKNKASVSTESLEITSIITKQINQNHQNETDQKPVDEPIPQSDSEPVLETPPLSVTPIQTTPGFGGGGGRTTESQVSAPVQSVLSVDSPIENAYVASSIVSFSGTAGAGALITADVGTTIATTSADGSGNWSITMTLSEGIAQVSFIATVTGKSASGTIMRNINVDTVPPSAPSLSVTECSASLSSASCVVATTTIEMAWGDVVDASYYGIVQSGAVISTTTATSSSIAIIDGATATLAVVAYDDAGNTATSSDVSLVGIARPAIINEIAWGGDRTSAGNQWIELKNLTSYEIDASYLSIVRQDGSVIYLSGNISATNNPFVVVQPFSISSTGSKTLIVSFSPLSTSTAEHLSLVWNSSTTIDETPAQDTCGGWCAGKKMEKLGSNASGVNDLYSPLSMERTSDSADGSLANSWQDTDSYGPYIGHSNSDALWGTPGGENSGGLPDSGVYCESSGNLADTHTLSYSDPHIGCTYLMRFITGSTFGVNRYASLYRGTVGSSTQVIGHSYGKELADAASETMPSDAQAGEDFFFSMWEQRSGPAFNDDTANFNNYFTQSASTTLNYTPPHGNYVVIPWTYQ